MKQFRTKPLEVTAVQFNGRIEPTREIIGWIVMCGGGVQFIGPGDPHPMRTPGEPGAAFLVLETTEEPRRVDLGDWVIRNNNAPGIPAIPTDAGFSCCSPSDFERAYEPAVDEFPFTGIDGSRWVLTVPAAW
ncbi:hypothetical protein [Nocardia sp. NBC_00511]|uniref:hypothetical protein n=1 Tax=Nocardia sp. NBC_00511 TaxID=2903591 RepID=UPI0030DE5A11